MNYKKTKFLLALGLFLLCSSALAADAVPGIKVSLDTLWIITAGCLVFFMQAGFALLEAGMVRSKNTVNVVMKNYTDMCFGAVAFWLFGYGLMFGANPSGFIGTDHFFLNNQKDFEYFHNHPYSLLH